MKRLIDYYLAVWGNDPIRKPLLLRGARQVGKTYAVRKFGPKRHQIKYLELLFKEIPRQLSHKFKYSNVEGEYRKRELAPALDLLETAGLINKVYYSAAQGFPIGAQINLQDFKVIFLDIGLAQTMLSLNLADWFLNPLDTLINKGATIEAFVGQEMLAYADPFIDEQLFYWHRESPSSQAMLSTVALQSGLGSQKS